MSVYKMEIRSDFIPIKHGTCDITRVTKDVQIKSSPLIHTRIDTGKTRSLCGASERAEGVAQFRHGEIISIPEMRKPYGYTRSFNLVDSGDVIDLGRSESVKTQQIVKKYLSNEITMKRLLEESL